MCRMMGGERRGPAALPGGVPACVADHGSAIHTCMNGETCGSVWLCECTCNFRGISHGPRTILTLRPDCRLLFIADVHCAWHVAFDALAHIELSTFALVIGSSKLFAAGFLLCQRHALLH